MNKLSVLLSTFALGPLVPNCCMLERCHSQELFRSASCGDKIKDNLSCKQSESCDKYSLNNFEGTVKSKFEKLDEQLNHYDLAVEYCWLLKNWHRFNNLEPRNAGSSAPKGILEAFDALARDYANKAKSCGYSELRKNEAAVFLDHEAVKKFFYSHLKDSRVFDRSSINLQLFNYLIKKTISQEIIMNAKYEMYVDNLYERLKIFRAGDKDAYKEIRSLYEVIKTYLEQQGADMLLSLKFDDDTTAIFAQKHSGEYKRLEDISSEIRMLENNPEEKIKAQEKKYFFEPADVLFDKDIFKQRLGAVKNESFFEDKSQEDSQEGVLSSKNELSSLDESKSQESLTDSINEASEGSILPDSLSLQSLSDAATSDQNMKSFNSDASKDEIFQEDSPKMFFEKKENKFFLFNFFKKIFNKFRS